MGDNVMSVKINGSTGIDTIQDKVYNATGVKNWIINGQFDVWQRGTSQTATGYGSDDRWNNSNVGSTKTHSRQTFTIGQTDVPNNPTYFSRTVISSISGASNFSIKYQHIEDVTKLAGKTVTVSFWAKADASRNLSIDFYQNMGVGGSAGVTAIGVQKFALTTSWQRFTKTISVPSISGKTVGTSSYTEFVLWFDAGSDFNARTDSLGNQSGTFDIANVCLVEGSTAMECPSEPYAEVLRKCQRYYYRLGGQEAYSTWGFALSNSATSAYGIVNFSVSMRVRPTSVDYANTRFENSTGSSFSITSITVNQVASHELLAYLNCVTTGLTANNTYIIGSNNSLSGYIAFSAEL